jgi:hypothetical protein
MREKSVLGFGEGLLILEVNGKTDLIEFSDDISQMEGEEIFQFEILYR